MSGVEARTAAFPELLAELDAVLAAGGEARLPHALAERAGSPLLRTLFEVELRRLVRMGPGAGDPASHGHLPRRALELAAGAAAAGQLPWAAVVALRRLLDRLAGKLRDAGAWHPEAPLWWQPLPPPCAAETQWQHLDAALETAFAAKPDLGAGHGTAGLLPAELLDALHDELGGAHERQLLALEAGTVGAEDRRSARRSDAVRYLSGLEPDVLAAAPRLAVLVQWCLERLTPRLGTVLAGTVLAGTVLRSAASALRPPQRAMLARYPGPSAGFAPHLDNPGGDHDNGRAVSLVLYLNPDQAAPRGGELVLWAPGARTDAAPAAQVAPRSGTLAFFDSRRVAHQVRPLDDGPARWTLALWLNDGGAATLPATLPPSLPPSLPQPELPEPSVAELLLAVPSPPLPAGTFLLHELPAADGCGEAAGRFHVHRRNVHRCGVAPRADGAARPRVAVVVTTHGAGTRLDDWCRHHLDLGVDHLVVIFDRLEDAAETATAERLRAAIPAERLTIWSGEELARDGWRQAGDALQAMPDGAALRDLAVSRRRSSQSVAARQALNATAALAVARRDSLGGAGLDAAAVDWLLHLDDDELWLPRGDGRGGSGLADHLAAAAELGHALVRYANYELLLPSAPGRRRFKVNPHVARARLGPRGWQALCDQLDLAPDGRRPWFHGYVNGKSAVRVRPGVAAAGVHGWWLAAPDGRGVTAGPSWHLDGPTVLHLRYPTEESFAARYLAKAADGADGDADLFAPSALEQRAVALVAAARRRGTGDADLRTGLTDLYRRATHFSDEEIDLLDDAGLLLDDPTVG